MVRHWLLLSMLLAGCGRIGFGDQAIDAEVVLGADTGDSGGAATCPVRWGAPITHSELRTSTTSVEDPTVSANRLRIVFSSAAAGGVGGKDLWMSERAQATEPFRAPVNLTALNTTADDNAGELSPDGNTLYFTTNRTGSNDVYVSTYNGDLWGAPVPVAALSTPDRGELELAVSSDQLTAIVNRDADMTLYTRSSTSMPWGNATVRPELHITTDVASPSLTSTAVYLHAGSVRDMYVACRNPDNSFGTPQPIADVNTVERDADPFVLEGDGVMFYNCHLDICEVTRQ